MLQINWIDNTRENLLSVYRDYVKQVEKDKSLMIVTSVIGLMPYKKPTTGVKKNTIFVEQPNKIMTSVLKIFWAENRTTPQVEFAFMNGNPDKFYRFEDINLDGDMKYTIKCYNCKELVKYTSNDIVDDVYVICPDCGQHLVILE